MTDIDPIDAFLDAPAAAPQPDAIDAFLDAAPQQPAAAASPQTTKVNFYGRAIDVDPADVASSLASFRETPEFAAMIDKTREADWGASSAAGGVNDPADKLATVRLYYPDAQPYSDDNFVFTHPETGKPTLYNAPGLSLRDVFSVTRDVTVAAAGGVGAVGGFLLGAPSGPGALVTTLGGAAGGSALGGAAFDATMENFGYKIDTRSLDERVSIRRSKAWQARPARARECCSPRAHRS